MINRTLAIFLFLILCVQAITAQRNCATLDHWEYVVKKHSSTAQSRALIERHTQLYTQNPELRNENNIVIPVVINVVYQHANENISDEQILEQIRVLNEDFGRLNPDADGAWPQAANTDLQFQLANRAPDGTPTTGIRRRYTSYSNFSTYDDVKFAKSGGIDAWPTEHYLNIWVCNLEGDIMGYGQLPGGPAATDGVVIDFQFFGRYGHTQAPFDRGRTATHEVGHWLNLFHIWGDGDCTIDDMVADTPDSDEANHGCPKDAYSCGGKLMVQNFMDYTDDACMNLFTQGQARRMQALFATGGFRSGFLRSPGLMELAQMPDVNTCNDGRQNGDETGVDCGGSCEPCASKISCPAPASINQSNSTTKVTLRWEAVSASGYLAEIRQLKPNLSKWASVVTNSTSASVSGIRIGRTYEWRVRAICQEGDTSDVTGSVFITRNNGRILYDDQPAVYPNPSRGTFYFNPGSAEAPDGPLLFDAGGGDSKTIHSTTSFLLVKNIQGQLVKTHPLNETAQAGFQVDVPGLVAGMYFVHWIDAEGQPLSQAYKLILY
ncbi:M43 family zinc metalloprotease [Haliscomenobacter hydrossis]|uniref:Fibronectin type III domain protein n=1 Tax=Haliscomenobacter hydrossis (strain ATCC 27775 / DSM 1100 / LMG 10767 / O) TaxID=760192 RepID=F4KZI8_HALH1|nr:M43 family zinc metalloprotease [Haliscomenobacter hydrossis]AEE49458.1 Fibronectin type III domain protein [Haliscomenobacter hydrossis DSM 1100]